jgi:hypothetical protein
MMDDSGADVVVRVEVWTKGRRRVRKKRLLALVVSLPNGTANVLVQPGATNGSICAKGTGAIKGGVLANYVYARVYTGNVTPAPNPPPGTPATVPFGPAGNWEFLALPGANCNAGGTAPNTLVTWTDFGGPGYEVLATPFTGKCSNRTDCMPGSGSGSGSGSAVGAPVGETVPRQWNVVGVGFTGAGDPFNRIWLLSAPGGEGEPSAWDNGGDGKAEPRVELRHDRPAALWRLSLLLGKYAAHYESRASDWRPLNANVLERASGEAPPRGAPPYVTVVPV